MQYDFQRINEIIATRFEIEDVNYPSDPRNKAVAQYVGKLTTEDSEEAYDFLESQLSEIQLTPVFREQDGRQFIILIPSIAKRKQTNPRVNLVLFILTLLSVLLTGGLYGSDAALPSNAWQAILTIIKNGWPFAISLLAILGAHEFGHYFAGKKHGVDVTLPYFIPFPFNTFGTMGAFINMRSVPKNKKQLFDISIAGPLSGLIVSIFVLLIGLSLSSIEALPTSLEPGMGLQMEGNSILYILLKYISFGSFLPQAANLNGLPQMINQVQYFFTGVPFPWGGMDVMLHPVAWAGWAGLFVTMLNLIPAGQLDGGHILQSTIGVKRSRQLLPIILAVLVLLGFFWNTWWFWAVMIMFMGRNYAEPMDGITPLDPKRKTLGIIMLIIFVLIFIPVPLTIVMG